MSHMSENGLVRPSTAASASDEEDHRDPASDPPPTPPQTERPISAPGTGIRGVRLSRVRLDKTVAPTRRVHELRCAIEPTRVRSAAQIARGWPKVWAKFGPLIWIFNQKNTGPSNSRRRLARPSASESTLWGGLERLDAALNCSKLPSDGECRAVQCSLERLRTAEPMV
jgi:hypothetical protein